MADLSSTFYGNTVLVWSIALIVILTEFNKNKLELVYTTQTIITQKG